MSWISALRSTAIRQLVDAGHLQLSLFDERDLAEIRAPEYPGERLIVCRNPLLAEERRRKRAELLDMTARDLARIQKEVARRRKTPLGEDEIGVKVGKVIGRFKMGKHFIFTIQEGRFDWQRNEEAIEREAALDGIYVVRTSEPEERLAAEDVVRKYKSLSQLERLFRTLKGIDIRVRPIRHWAEPHVRAHIFLCTLAFYVEWHMRQALKPLLFEDEELEHDRKTRDPVAPARPSESVKTKKMQRVTADGLTVNSFETLIQELGTHCRNLCRMQSDPEAPAFVRYTERSPLQKRALELLGLYPGRQQ